LHFGYDARGFLDPIHAGLAQVCLLGNGTDCGDVVLDIPSNELPVATHTARQVNKVVGVADGANALGDLLTLPGETLVLVARGEYRKIKRPFPPTPARGEHARHAPAAGQPCRQPAGHRPAQQRTDGWQGTGSLHCWDCSGGAWKETSPFH